MTSCRYETYEFYPFNISKQRVFSGTIHLQGMTLNMANVDRKLQEVVSTVADCRRAKRRLHVNRI